jgi:predicted RNase H-like nuclease (RuvC/YqgF family)
MAKRRTIGENPLDAVVQGHPLDAVVPDPQAATQVGRARAEEELKEQVAQLAKETKTALARLEAEISAVKGELAQLRTEVLRLQAKAPPTDLPFWMRGFSK